VSRRPLRRLSAHLPLHGARPISISLPLIIGSIPGAYIGARLSARLPGGWVRRALAFVLLASGLKLVGVPTDTTGLVLVLVLVGAGRKSTRLHSSPVQIWDADGC